MAILPIHLVKSYMPIHPPTLYPTFLLPLQARFFALLGTAINDASTACYR